MKLLNDLMVSLGLVEKNNTASTAKERLKVVVSHSGARRKSSPDYLPMLEKDILAVIAKYVEVDQEKVKIRFDRRDSQSTLEVNVDLPSEMESRSKAKAAESKKASESTTARSGLVEAARGYKDASSASSLKSKEGRRLVETE